MILKKKILWYLNFIFLLNQSNVYADTTANKAINIYHQKNTEESIKKIATIDQFLTILDSVEPTVIFASMKNCPHCKIVKPKFKNASLNKKHHKIKFTQVNGPALKIHKHVARESKDKFKIPGYPSFIFVKNKKIVDVLIGGEIKELEQKLKNLMKL